MLRPIKKLLHNIIASSSAIFTSPQYINNTTEINICNDVMPNIMQESKVPTATSSTTLKSSNKTDVESTHTEDVPPTEICVGELNVTAFSRDAVDLSMETNYKESELIVPEACPDSHDTKYTSSELIVLDGSDLNKTEAMDPESDPLAIDDFQLIADPLKNTLHNTNLSVLNLKSSDDIFVIDVHKLEPVNTKKNDGQIIEDINEEQEIRSDGSDSGLGSETLAQQNTLNCDTSTRQLKSHLNMKEFRRSNLKRQAQEHTCHIQKKTKRSINFDEVKVYYFPRMQGFGCVPSQGGCTLGMGSLHTSWKSFTLAEHAAEQRKAHKQQLQDINPRGSSSDDTDSEEEITDGSASDLDADTNGFLQPVHARQRRAMLKAAGIRKIDSSEKDDCRQIRNSREICGCNCRGFCDPDTCSCSQDGIKCQVDRLNFPCGCSRDGCGNIIGRVEFNQERVRTHYFHTKMRLNLENGGIKRQDENPSRVIYSKTFENSEVISGSNRSTVCEKTCSSLSKFSTSNSIQESSTYCEIIRPNDFLIMQDNIYSNSSHGNLTPPVEDLTTNTPHVYSSDNNLTNSLNLTSSTTSFNDIPDAGILDFQSTDDFYSLNNTNTFLTNQNSINLNFSSNNYPVYSQNYSRYPESSTQLPLTETSSNFVKLNSDPNRSCLNIVSSHAIGKEKAADLPDNHSDCAQTCTDNSNLSTKQFLDQSHFKIKNSETLNFLCDDLKALDNCPSSSNSSSGFFTPDANLSPRLSDPELKTITDNMCEHSLVPLVASSLKYPEHIPESINADVALKSQTETNTNTKSLVYENAFH